VADPIIRNPVSAAFGVNKRSRGTKRISHSSLEYSVQIPTQPSSGIFGAVHGLVMRRIAGDMAT
jgi:hypothetical protein